MHRVLMGGTHDWAVGHQLGPTQRQTHAAHGSPGLDACEDSGDQTGFPSFEKVRRFEGLGLRLAAGEER